MIGETSASVRLFGNAQPHATVCVAREVPIALVYNGVSHAVMMATPDDLADFGLGFSMTEGILHDAHQLYDLSIVEKATGFSVEMSIASERLSELKALRRTLTGRTGCGICGTQSLAHAVGPTMPVKAPEINDGAIQNTLHALSEHQPLMNLTGATHAAFWCDLHGKIILTREDVGRHNALDKLIGALYTSEIELAQGFVVVTSRASYEMVQKCCAVGIGALIAVSAATSLAIQHAKNAGLLLVGFSRSGRHVIYADPYAD